tara:strand:+ start:367 stop:702 length:336 start_codon:yes stop_codon:yes gene_type:complete
MGKGKWGEKRDTNKQTNRMIYILMTLIELVIIYKLGKWLNDLEKNQKIITDNQQKLVTLIRLQHTRSQNYIVDMVLLGLQPDDESDDEEQSPPEYSETDNSENEEAMLLAQ